MCPGTVARDVHQFPEPRELAAPGPASAGTVDVPGGHLWIQEHVSGAPLGFSVGSSGLIRFGTVGRTFEEVPLPYRFAARHVRETLDREAILAAAEDPSAVTVFGVATRREVVDYDWNRLAPFLVTDIRAGARDTLLPPDALERACERLGLTPSPAVEKEVPSRHFSVETYEIPASRWYDGPAAGVLLRNKTGERALRWNPDLSFERPEPLDSSPRAAAERFVTDSRVERVRRAVRDGADEGHSPGFDEIFERVLEDVVRREYPLLYRDGDLVVDSRDFRSAAAERVRRSLDGHPR